MVIDLEHKRVLGEVPDLGSVLLKRKRLLPLRLFRRMPSGNLRRRLIRNFALLRPATDFKPINAPVV